MDFLVRLVVCMLGWITCIELLTVVGRFPFVNYGLKCEWAKSMFVLFCFCVFLHKISMVATHGTSYFASKCFECDVVDYQAWYEISMGVSGCTLC